MSNREIIGDVGAQNRIDQAVNFKKCLSESFKNTLFESGAQSTTQVVGNVLEQKTLEQSSLDITWIPENPPTEDEAILRSQIPGIIKECATKNELDLGVSESKLGHMAIYSSSLSVDEMYRAVTGRHIVFALKQCQY